MGFGALAARLATGYTGRDPVVLGGNASTVQPDRVALLERNGYRHVFSMVEMEHTGALAALAWRHAGPVRLHTEGHDPAGARSLYERLGFRVVREYRRYRKPLGD